MSLKTYIRLAIRYKTISPYEIRRIRGLKRKYHRKNLRKKILSVVGGCSFCGKKNNLTIDHIIPKSKGGTNKKENLQALCAPCNYKKADKILTR